jgi:cation-transporting ATPase I
VSTVEALRRVVGAAGRLLPVDKVHHLLAEMERSVTSAGEGDPPTAEPPVGAANSELVTLGTYVVGAGLATVGSLTRLSRLPSAVPAFASAVTNLPQLREAARARLGPARTERLVATGESVLAVLAGHPAGLLVNAVHSSQRIREARARERVWARRAPALFAAALGSGPPEAPVEPEAEETAGGDGTAAGRPVPLPPGPVERYAAQAASAGIAGLVGGVVTARPGLRTAALAAASAKAARLTKESWASRVARSAGSTPW